MSLTFNDDEPEAHPAAYYSAQPAEALFPEGAPASIGCDRQSSMSPVSPDARLGAEGSPMQPNEDHPEMSPGRSPPLPPAAHATVMRAIGLAQERRFSEADQVLHQVLCEFPEHGNAREV